MPARRHVLALGAVVGLAAVSACQKPSPYVTVVAGKRSASAQAVCYAHRGSVNPTCANEVRAKVLPVQPGDRVGISVDSSLLPGGWYVAAQQRRSRRVTDHYFSFQVGDLRGRDMVLRVVDLDQGQRRKGFWVFRLREQ